LEGRVGKGENEKCIGTLCTFIGTWKCGRDRGLRREGSEIAVETLGGYEGRGFGFMHNGINVRVAIDGVRS
jgi:hypothetical protein